MSVKDQIIASKIVAIVRGIDSDKIVNTVEALYEGGIRCVEVTFNAKDEEKSKDTLKAIELISKNFGDDVLVGAGTVLTPKMVLDAYNVGAKYMISPNTSREVIEETKRLNLVSIPGAVTPTEIINAYEYGADIVKLFPAATLGLEYIKAIVGPINHIPFTAVGGINAGNAKDFIDAGCVGVSVGGNLVNKKLIDAGKFDEIVKLASEYKF